MEFTEEEERVQEEAMEEIKNKKADLIETLILKKKPLRLGVASIFMAGSPGAGKTEFSKRYIDSDINFSKSTKKLLAIKGINLNDFETLFIRIDVDEIRCFLTQYRKTDVSNGIKGNAHILQKAANKGLDILRRYCFENNISFIHDSTFGNYSTMERLIKKSLVLGRQVQIIYIYLDPVEAWNFTKAREFLEGRNIVKDKFIDQYFSSKKNVDKIKKKFGNKIRVHCVFKNNNNEVEKVLFDQSSIDECLKKKYNEGSLKEYSLSDLQKIIL